jgi:LysR family transcriptional activator of dmlA
MEIHRTRIVNNLPPLEDLRLFCAVARNRSFLATAKERGVSPAFVSKRIALLEAALKVRLLHRTTRRVGLNEDGATVYQWALRILEDAEQMAEAVSAARTEPRGLLRISASAGFGRKRIAPALSGLARAHPGLRIHLELLSRPVDLVAEGFDLDLRIGGDSDPGLIVRRIRDNARVLCAAPAYAARCGLPESLRQLEAHACIVVRERDQSFGIWNLQGPRGPEAAHVSGPLSCSNGEVARQWALDGHGIILRSTWDVTEDLEAGLLLRVLPEYRQDAPVCAVYPLRLTESAKVRVCVEHLQACLRPPGPD